MFREASRALKDREFYFEFCFVFSSVSHHSAGIWHSEFSLAVPTEQGGTDVRAMVLNESRFRCRNI